jgi:hypothetical protein
LGERTAVYLFSILENALKKFILKIIFFVLPFTFLLIEGFLPLSTFTYRPWEALLYTSGNGSPPFYPNQNLTMYSTGDLCHHTTFRILKKENWITDKLGYRNDAFVKRADVLLIGDSFIAGSGLPQDSTLANALKNKLNTSVYNIAPAGFDDFIYLLNSNIIEKPKTIIFGFVERSIPPKIQIPAKKLTSPNVNTFSIFLDKISRLYSIRYLKSRMLGMRGNGIQGISDPTMFFLNGLNEHYNYETIHEVVENIVSYDAYCRAIGVQFIVLPLPNKETAYFENVPFKNQPDYLFKLDSLLNLKKIARINSLKLFNDYKDHATKYIYLQDDTHWNSNGVNIVAEEICKSSQTNEARNHNIILAKAGQK